MSSPEDRLETLRSELRRACGDARTARLTYETFKIAARDTALLHRLGGGWAAQGFQIIRDSVHKDVVMSLMRVWDKGNDAFNIERYATRLSEYAIVALLEQERRDAEAESACFDVDGMTTREYARSEADKAAADVRKEIAAVQARIAEVWRDDVLMSIKHIRNTMLAHTSIADLRDAQPNRFPPPQAKYGDERTLLDWTEEILGALWRCAFYQDRDFQPVTDMGRKAAHGFWEVVARSSGTSK